jgi:hypothetical protein
VCQGVIDCISVIVDRRSNRGDELSLFQSINMIGDL